MTLDVRDGAENPLVGDDRGFDASRERVDDPMRRRGDGLFRSVLLPGGEQLRHDSREFVVRQPRDAIAEVDLAERAAFPRLRLDEDDNVEGDDRGVHGMRLSRRNDRSAVFCPIVPLARAEPDPRFGAEGDLDGVMRVHGDDAHCSANHQAAAVPRHEMPESSTSAHFSARRLRRRKGVTGTLGLGGSRRSSDQGVRPLDPEVSRGLTP